MAVSALEFGGSVGKLLWVSVSDPQMRPAEADRYTQLARCLRTQIDTGRASSEVGN